MLHVYMYCRIMLLRWCVLFHTVADFGVARVLERTSVAKSFCGEYAVGDPTKCTQVYVVVVCMPKSVCSLAQVHHRTWPLSCS